MKVTVGIILGALVGVVAGMGIAQIPTKKVEPTPSEADVIIGRLEELLGKLDKMEESLHPPYSKN